MTTCAVCNKDKQEGMEKIIYTGRKISEESRHGSGNTTLVTKTYSEFQKHSYFLCSKCHILWDRIVLWGGIGLTIVAIFIFIRISIKQQLPWIFVLVLFCFLPVLAGIEWFSSNERFKKLARQERGEDGVEAFTERGYNHLLEQDKIWG